MSRLLEKRVINKNCTSAKPGEDEAVFADKLYMTGNRCVFAHIFSFIRLEFYHFSAIYIYIISDR
jgi:hypothetical protein